MIYVIQILARPSMVEVEQWEFSTTKERIAVFMRNAKLAEREFRLFCIPANVLSEEEFE